MTPARNPRDRLQWQCRPRGNPSRYWENIEAPEVFYLQCEYRRVPARLARVPGPYEGSDW